MQKDIKEIFSANLNKLMKSRGENLTELSEALEVSYSTVSDWKHGKKMARSGALQNIATHYKVNLSYLTTDHSSENTTISSNSEYNYFDTTVAAGALTATEAITTDGVEKVSLSNLSMGRYAGNTDIFVTRVTGDSMNNIIPDNSLIAVKHIDSAFDLSDRDIVVFRNGDGLSVKRFFNDKENQRLVFKPDSSHEVFTDIVVSYEDSNDLQIYGKVVVYIVQL